ncbi:hypothetical protein H5410_038143 [Solanum commersonii]|uniref:Uncharacterized protein n=1 Tax=Solanum commersonii TaxID=4109 RepID=A0A9J5YAG5_SOLCO|nr:hypothetical protein H5410_038143 [Solanum commersonii]
MVKRLDLIAEHYKLVVDAMRVRETEDLVEDLAQESADYHCSLGLQVVSGLSNELENLSHSLVKTKEFLDTDMRSLEDESKFRDTLTNFIQHTEQKIT